MPTGYTADLEDGKITSLRDYAFSCARGMGFLIHMRDDAHDAEIVPREVPQYLRDSVTSAEAKLEKLLELSDDEWQILERGRHVAASKRGREFLSDAMHKYNRYFRMRAKVVAWECPEELKGLKDFMLSQIDLCMEYPDSTSSWYKPVRSKDWQTFKDVEIAEARRSLAYAKKNLADEEKRVVEANLYLDLLKDCFRD